jgi:hypothetical protein
VLVAFLYLVLFGIRVAFYLHMVVLQRLRQRGVLTIFFLLLRMMYSTPQLLDEHIWVPVRDLFIQQCGHAGYSVLEGIRDGLHPPREMWEAAERGLLLPSLSLCALDPAGSVPGTWRDWAVQAGRPSPLLRREALMAREAAANLIQQAQVGVVVSSVDVYASELTDKGARF